MKLLIASTNSGKLRDFAGAATLQGVEVELLPGMRELPEAIEDGTTFEENARKKSEHYSRFVPGQYVVADDSGLVVDALNGAPGVYSARYAELAGEKPEKSQVDEANNALLLRNLKGVGPEDRTGRFVCVISVAKDGREEASFRGTAEGEILDHPRGSAGFGYDPLFYFPSIGKTFAELLPTEKAKFSHRGSAFQKLLGWCDANKLAEERATKDR